MNQTSGRKWERFTALSILLIMAQVAGCHRKEAGTTANTVNAASQHVAKAEPLRGKAKPNPAARKSPSPKPAVSTTISYIPTVNLLPLDSVLQELHLTAAQKKKLAEIDQKRLEATRNWSEAGEGTLRQQMATELVAAQHQLGKEVAEILDENQRNRLARISIQVNGPISLADGFVAATLKITDEQRSKLMEIRNKKNNEMHKLLKTIGETCSVKDIFAESGEIAAKEDKEVLALLTSEQEHQFKSFRKPILLTSLSTPVMATKLNISDAQKAQLIAIQKSFKQQQSSLIESVRGNDPAGKDLQPKLQQLRTDADKKMLAVLTDQQRQTFESLPREPRRPIALINPEIAAKLNVTDEQKTKLAAIRKTDRKTLQSLGKEVHKREASRKEMMAKVKELRAEADKEMLAVLTVEQSLGFATLKGNSPSISFRQLQASNNSAK